VYNLGRECEEEEGTFYGVKKKLAIRWKGVFEEEPSITCSSLSHSTCPLMQTESLSPNGFGTAVYM